MKRQFLRVGIVAGFLAWALAIRLAAPAAACTVAADLTLADHRNAADLVFTGTAVRVDDPSNGINYSTGDPVYWTFAVDGVEKGDAADRVNVATAMDGSSCGYTFELGKRYRVFAAYSDWFDHLATGLGNGNVVLASLPDPPPVEGTFHSLAWNAIRLGLVTVPAVGVLALIGLGWWAFRRGRRQERAIVQ